jgi:hypothetical protein
LFTEAKYFLKQMLILMNKRIQQWSTPRSRNLFKALKDKWVDEYRVRMVVFWFWNGDKLGRFTDSGEKFKYQYMVLKSSTRWLRALRERIRMAGAEIPSVHGAGLVLRT